MNNKWQSFIKIAKVDKDEQMVYGYASTPDIDSDGEIIKVEALEKALPNYLKFPTIREMHQPKAVGTTKEAKITKKGLYIGAKIVNKDAWELVKEGVYKAFSIGGDVLKRTGNIIQELALVEVSLVDVPANKAAVIEVWKRGKVSKDAETAYSMANLMIQVKDAISYYEYLGKDTKKLNNALETIKEVLVQEASEKEPKSGQNEVNMGIFDADSATDLQKKIDILKGINFGNNHIAHLIREGVIENMKAKKLKKDEEVVDDEEEVETEEVETETEETTDDPKKGKSDDVEVEEVETETETETVEETQGDEKESGVIDPELTKSLSSIEAAQKKVEKVQKVDVTVKDENISKAIGSIAKTLSTLADGFVAISERVERLEKQPAAPKSVATVVKKTILENNGQEEVKERTYKNPQIAEKKKEHAELVKKFNELGAHQFAKQGYSAQAMKLESEITDLIAKENATG